MLFRLIDLNHKHILSYKSYALQPDTKIMDEDKISMILIECLSSKEYQTYEKPENDKIQKDNETSTWNICRVLSVLAICLLCLATDTLVPRTNSILYQSYWYEISSKCFVTIYFSVLLLNNTI